MHIFFSGIGGSGISALALIAKQAGYAVSGSDARPSQYLEYLRKKGVTNTYVGLSRKQIEQVHAKNPIDWYVHGSAQLMDFPDNAEFLFCKEQGIKISKRDELLNEIINQKNLKLIAIAGTHGKSTTTAMVVWLFQQLGLSVSYSVGAKISFGDIGHFDPASQYFVYEADEFDRNFLAFQPCHSLITGVDWDHPDIYPSRGEYYDAFRQFLEQSQQAVLWQSDVDRLNLESRKSWMILDEDDPEINKHLKLAGLVNRQNAWQVVKGLQPILNRPLEELIKIVNDFPGLSRRFEEIIPNLYSDYAHTPGKIRGALQLAQEVTGNKVVVVYEGLHNLRQHFIKEDLKNLFDDAKQLYIVPTYLGRENKDQPVLSPADLVNLLSKSTKDRSEASELDESLAEAIKKHLSDGDLVLCLTAGGPASLDEWLRQNFGS